MNPMYALRKPVVTNSCLSILGIASRLTPMAVGSVLGHKLFLRMEALN